MRCATCKGFKQSYDPCKPHNERLQDESTAVNRDLMRRSVVYMFITIDILVLIYYCPCCDCICVYRTASFQVLPYSEGSGGIHRGNCCWNDGESLSLEL